MHEIATNLLTNAMKFTPAGGSVLLETGLAEDSGRGLAMLRVSDTGIGIPPDELPLVSQRFFRGQRSAGIAGSGIGLTIVAELVRGHHGRMEVSSGPEAGTAVTVTLPVAAGPAAAGPVRAGTVAPDRPARRPAPSQQAPADSSNGSRPGNRTRPRRRARICPRDIRTRCGQVRSPAGTRRS